MRLNRKAVAFGISLAFFGGVLLLVIPLGNYFYLKNVPGRTERVEVVGKRVRKDTSGDASSWEYFVSFEFPDGSVKEFVAGRPDKEEFYKAIQEGDTGVLTYKERGSAKRFERFEKDPECGGDVIEPYRQGDLYEMIGVVVMVVVSFFAAWGILYWILINKDEERRKNGRG